MPMESNNKKVILSFKAPPPRSYAQIIPAVIFIPGIFAMMIYLSSRYNELNSSKGYILFYVSIVGLVLSLYSFIRFALAFWKSAYFVDLTEDSVIGYNLWKQPKEILYNDIVSIKKDKRSNSILVISNNRVIMDINPNIDYFGKCVEAIRERAINVKEVDYGGLDKDQTIWNHYYGWDEKMKKIDERFPRKNKK